MCLTYIKIESMKIQGVWFTFHSYIIIKSRNGMQLLSQIFVWSNMSFKYLKQMAVKYDYHYCSLSFFNFSLLLRFQLLI